MIKILSPGKALTLASAVFIYTSSVAYGTSNEAGHWSVAQNGSNSTFFGNPYGGLQLLAMGKPDPDPAKITIPQWICNLVEPQQSTPNPSCDKAYEFKQNGNKHAKVLIIDGSSREITTESLYSEGEIIEDSENPLPGNQLFKINSELSDEDQTLTSDFDLIFGSLAYGAVAEIESILTFKLENGSIAPLPNGNQTTGCIKRFPLNVGYEPTEPITDALVFDYANTIPCSPEGWNSADLVIVVNSPTDLDYYTREYATQDVPGPKTGGVINNMIDFLGIEPVSTEYELSITVNGSAGERTEYLENAQPTLGLDYTCYSYSENQELFDSEGYADSSLAIQGFDGETTSLLYDTFNNEITLSNSDTLAVDSGSTIKVTCVVYTLLTETSSDPRKKVLKEAVPFSSDIRLSLTATYEVPDDDD